MRGAASTPSGGADEALCSTTGKANFQRVTRLLISAGTRLLRDTFDSIYTPSVLPLRLNDPAVKKALKAAKLTKPLWDCLYPSPGAYGKSTDFDITLLFRLLRTICLLSPPPTGWDDLPNSTDHSLTADLVRVKFYRNSVYGHVNENMEIEDSDFQHLWKEIKEPLLRIAGNISTAKKDEWEKAIELLSRDPLTPEDERCVEELKGWYKNDLDVKEALEELTATTQEGVSRLEREVAGVNEGVEETSQVVRDIKDQMEQVQESMDRLSSSASGTQTGGARLRLRIDCEAITEFGTESGASSELAVTSQQHPGESHEQALAPVIVVQPQATEPRATPERKRGCPSEQEVLNSIALKYLNNDELASPNAFLKYLTDVRKVLVLDVGQGSLLITVECGSLQILEDLWQDYLSGHLNQMVQEHLVTADILKELGLVETKIIMKTTILEEDYRACREYFLHSPGPPNSDEKDQADKSENDGASSISLFESEESQWQKVGSRPTKPRRGEPFRGRGQGGHQTRPGFGPKTSQDKVGSDKWSFPPSPEEHSGDSVKKKPTGGVRGRGGPGRGQGRRSHQGRGVPGPEVPYSADSGTRKPTGGMRGRGGPGRGQGRRGFDGERRTQIRGGHINPSRAMRRQRSDPASAGFVHAIKYEHNKLYVLGLHYKTSKDGVKNYIERISGDDVKHVLWFKPKGKAIVTLKNKIRDFAKICSEAEKRKLDGVNVLIERAPVCKSIFVSGFSVKTSKEQVEEYFDGIGELENFVFNEKNESRDKRAIVYFKSEKSLDKAVKNDHRLDDTALHVEIFYPFLGTVEPVDQPTRMPHLPPGSLKEAEVPNFYKEVDSDIMEFLMNNSNQGLTLKEDLFSRERARVKWTNKDRRYVLIKYDEGGPKLGDEFEEWKRRCSEIINSCIERFAAREIPVEEEIWESVVNQLPQIQASLPQFTTQVKKVDESKNLILVCETSHLRYFEVELKERLHEIKREETFEHKEITDMSNEKLQLFRNVGIEKILKEEVHQDLQAAIKMESKTLAISTPKGTMDSAKASVRQRENEIDQNSTQNPPEILEILKTKVGKRKLSNEFKEAKIKCAFNVDVKRNEVLLLGRTPLDTVKGKELAQQVLVNDKLPVKVGDNVLLQSGKWNDLCKKLGKHSSIRYKRELTCISVFGFKKDVEEAVKKMRDFLNKKKATEGEFRFDSYVHRRLFNEFYRDEIQKIMEELSMYSVKITSDENGDLLYTGTEEGVREVEERLYSLQDKVKEKAVKISVPGMRSYLAQGGGDLISTTQQEHKCVIDIAEVASTQEDEAEVESDYQSSLSSDDEGFLHDDEKTLWTQEGKKLMWKAGNIEKEEADVLVCSVGSNLNLSIGEIARAMVRAAGPSLQEELTKKAKHLNVGDIIHTGPANLPCRYVVYGVCSPWNDGKGESEKILQTLLWKCFDKASELGACSIGMPLIGTGNLGFPCHVAVQIMVDTALNYSKDNPLSSIEEFRFIVYSSEESQEGISAFDDKFKKELCKMPRVPGMKTRRASRKRKVMPALPGSISKEVCFGDLKAKVVKTDITKECSDAICNVIGQELDMNVGKLSAVIAKASGSTVQDELNMISPQCSGSVVTTTAGYLPANHILHMVVTSANKRHLQECVVKALTEADSRDLVSVSMPAVGSGGLGLTPEESAEVVFGAISAFAAGTRNSVREVRIAVLDESVIWAFVKKLERETEADDREEEDIDIVACEGISPEMTHQTPETCGQLRLIVYGREEILDAAITALEDGVKKVCQTVVIEEDIIGRLPKRHLRDLRQKARERDVYLHLMKESAIELQGLPADVMKINAEVLNIIQEHMKKEYKEERAELTSNTVQWYLVSASGQHEPFDKLVNDEIETAFQSKKPSVTFTHKKSNAELNFGTRQVRIVKTGALKNVGRRPVIPLPNDWDPQPLDQHKRREERVHLVPLQGDSAAYKNVESRFLSTIPDGEKVSIVNIERVQNPSMYRSYIMKKQGMDEKNGNHKNELQLFHGTKYESVKAINTQGFNRSFCGQQGVTFGDGVYFAKDSYYSLAFSQPGPERHQCMYLASVLVGKYTKGDAGLRAPPPKDPNNPEHLYDSVVDSVDDPTIFVVFHDDQCYPDYLITFKQLAHVFDIM